MVSLSLMARLVEALRPDCRLILIGDPEQLASVEAGAVMEKMQELPINDIFTRNAVLRKDGRVVRDMYLAQVKTPAESKGPWDYLKIVQTVPGADAYRPVSESVCGLLKA